MSTFIQQCSKPSVVPFYWLVNRIFHPDDDTPQYIDILANTIPYNHQLAGVLNTAHM